MQILDGEKGIFEENFVKKDLKWGKKGSRIQSLEMDEGGRRAHRNRAHRTLRRD